MPGTLKAIVDVGGWFVLAAIILWGAWFFLKRSSDPRMLLFKWLASVALIGTGFFIFKTFHFTMGFAPLFVLFFGFPVGLIWAPSVGEMLFSSITNSFDGGKEQVEPAPLFSIAEAKRRRGLYQEALDELNVQLEKFPGDFRVLSMIAAVYADDLKDLAKAEAIMAEAFLAPNLPPLAVAAALNSMADWRLKILEDQDGARTYLERIVKQFPNTPLAQQASQRIAHLASNEDYNANKDRTPIHLKVGEKNIGLKTHVEPLVTEEDPAVTASQYLKQLEKFPLDSETREKLAMLYANTFQNVALATDQFEQLIAMPHETQKHIARWLNLLASVYINQAGDVPLAEKTLRRIIDLYPKAACAELAQTRIMSLKTELKQLGRQQNLKMGVYEKNLGLK